VALEGSKDGVNVIGYLAAEAGIGEAARLMIEGLRAAGVPVAAINYAKTSPSRQAHPLDALEPVLTDVPVYDTNLVCINAEELAAFAYDAGPEFFRGRRTIGFLWWELADFPQKYVRTLSLLDEIWVGSEYVAEAIRPATPKPVVTIPLPLRFPPAPELSRASVGLPDGFLFLFSFDFYGVFERKNPLGLVEAFDRAFPDGEGAVLVVKSINGDKFPDHLRRLRAATKRRSDVVVIDRYLDAEAARALTALCDCYVSLHRAEGFGLMIAEAMARGKPVIATGYSGNLAFMSDVNSYLVPYRLTVTPEGVPPYLPGVAWAEPDVDAAARLMRRVYEDREEAARRGELGQRSILKAYSVERGGVAMAARLDQVRTTGHRARGDQEAAWLETVVGSAVDRLGPTTQPADAYLLSAPTRLGFPVRVLRRTLWRLLWPYFFRDRALNGSVADALHALMVIQQRHARRIVALEQSSASAPEDG
jgi:glycosyltransferase involved in cell wall biosynthesis